MSSKWFLKPLVIHCGAKITKIGSQLGPQHGGNELTFSTLEPSWLHLGAILPPKWPQDPPRRHLGAILGPFLSHFGPKLGGKMCKLCPVSKQRVDTPKVGGAHNATEDEFVMQYCPLPRHQGNEEFQGVKVDGRARVSPSAS